MFLFSGINENETVYGQQKVPEVPIDIQKNPENGKNILSK